MSDQPTIIDGKVLPDEIYHPTMVVTAWFKTWSLRCGKCHRDFVRFAAFAKPKCPHCGTRNAPQMDYPV